MSTATQRTVRTAQEFSDTIAEIDQIDCLEWNAQFSLRRFERTRNLEDWWAAERYQKEANALKLKYQGGL